jgi:PKD repeat protein
VQFTGSDSLDPERGELSYEWDFGDGSAGSSVADPSHVYATAGTYTATLTVSAGGGRDDSASVEVRVAAPACDDGEDDDGDGKVDFPADLGCMSKADDDENTAPGAAIGAIPVSGDVPLSVAFSAAGSVDPEGDSLGYEWDFGDGSAGSSAAAANHLYTAPGTYTATLRVTDEHGVSDTATVEVEVTEPVRAVAGATPTSGRAPLPVQFTGSDSVDPEGGSLGYEWDFGDGSVGSSVADPSHVYMTPGTYTATLTVDAGGGREDSASVEVRVAESPVEEPGSNAGQPGSNAGQPGSNAGQPGSNAGQPGSNAGEPASPLPPPAFTGAKIQRRSVALKRGVASIRLTCSASAAALCSGKLALTARVGAAELKRSARARGSGARTTVRLATARFSIPSGETERVRVKLSRPGRRLLEAHRRLKTTAQVTAHDGLMRKRVTKSSLVLKLKRSRAGRARSGG